MESELHYEIKQPFKFYENLKHQTRFLKGANNSFELLCPKDRFLPFQLKREASASAITSIKLVSLLDEENPIEVLQNINSAQLNTVYFTVFDYLTYEGSSSFNGLTMASGQYYIIVEDATNTWYSEVFTTKDINPEDLSSGCAVSKITYSDTCMVGDIYYGEALSSFKNIIYLDIDIGKPSYPIEEQGDENGQGDFIAELKRLEKQYLLQGYFPEYLVDALTTLPLYVGLTGTVEVVTNRGYTGLVEEITVEPDWPTADGVYALTDIQFVTGKILKNNCCNTINTPLASCVRSYEEVIARIIEGSDNWQDFEYNKADDNSQVALIENDEIFMRTDQGTIRRYQIVSNNYAQLFNSPGDAGLNFVDLNQLEYGDGTTSPYYFYSGEVNSGYWQKPKIFNVEDQGPQELVTGLSFRDSIVEIWGKNTNNQSYLIEGNIDSNDFNLNGKLITVPANTSVIYLVAKGLNCDLGTGDNYSLAGTGIGIMIVEDTNIVG